MITGLTPTMVKLRADHADQHAERAAEHATAAVASARNWPRIAPLGAPMALRMPISLVRSVTVTSMMLVMPMPPTSRLDRRDRAEQHGEGLAVLCRRRQQRCLVEDLEVGGAGAADAVAAGSGLR